MDLDALISGLGLRVAGTGGGAGAARGGREGRGPGKVRVCDITEDSRTAVPGSLFIARAGAHADGRRYAAAAAECGAVAVLADTDDLDLPPGGPVVLVTDDVARAGAALAERFHGNPSSRLALVGVTGTNGKTSVATMTRALLQSAGVRTGLIGTVEIDDGREVARASMTTPPAVELSRALASMVDAGCRAACVEVSSHALDQRRADALRFSVAVFTNATGDHLDYHKSFDNYLGAKRRLFDLLPAAPDGVRVLNADDPHASSMGGADARWCTAQIGGQSGGQSGGSAPWAVSMDGRAGADLDGMTLTIRTPLGVLRGRVAAVGAHNAMNVLESVAAADAVLERLGLPEAERRDALERGLAGIRTPVGRLQRVSSPADQVAVFVDFAHTDDALTRTLGAVRAAMQPGALLTVVFGCGGDKDTTKRPRMGRVAAELADRVVVTSDNPRSERPGAIVDQVLAGVSPGDRGRVAVRVERGAAIRHAVMTALNGEVIVIAGKGHETEQISCDAAGHPVIRHFDDAEEARAALRERRLRGANPPSEPLAGGGGAKRA